jgi:uncharacterized membrane protein
MKKKYEKQITSIQGSQMSVNPVGMVLAYSFMLLGLCFFVMPNVQKTQLWQTSLQYGFTFGITLYGVYDFTNLALLKNWDLKLAIVDTLWGGLVYFLAALIGTAIG